MVAGILMYTILIRSIPAEDQTYLISFFDQLEGFIDLDFEFVDSSESADIAIFYDSEVINIEHPGATGLATESKWLGVLLFRTVQ